MHGQSENLRIGDRVEAGQKLGIIDRRHLHYEEIPETINGKPNPVYKEFITNSKTNTFTSTSHQRGTRQPFEGALPYGKQVEAGKPLFDKNQAQDKKDAIKVSDKKNEKASNDRASMMAYAMDQLRKEGVPEKNIKAAAAHLVGQAYMESSLNPRTEHDPVNGKATGYGIYGARYKRKDDMLKWMNDNKYQKDDPEGQMRYMAHEAMTSKDYRKTRDILVNADEKSLEKHSWNVTRDFERPAVINNRSKAVIDAYNTEPRDLKKERQENDAKLAAERVTPKVSDASKGLIRNAAEQSGKPAEKSIVALPAGAKPDTRSAEIEKAAIERTAAESKTQPKSEKPPEKVSGGESIIPTQLPQNTPKDVRGVKPDWVSAYANPSDAGYSRVETGFIQQPTGLNASF
jgi:hypothetical protein